MNNFNWNLIFFNVLYPYEQSKFPYLEIFKLTIFFLENQKKKTPVRFEPSTSGSLVRCYIHWDIRVLWKWSLYKTKQQEVTYDTIYKSSSEVVISLLLQRFFIRVQYLDDGKRIHVEFSFDEVSWFTMSETGTKTDRVRDENNGEQ